MIGICWTDTACAPIYLDVVGDDILLTLVFILLNIMRRCCVNIHWFWSRIIFLRLMCTIRWHVMCDLIIDYWLQCDLRWLVCRNCSPENVGMYSYRYTSKMWWVKDIAHYFSRFARLTFSRLYWIFHMWPRAKEL